MQDGHSNYTTETISHNLNLIFENIPSAFSGLEDQIELSLSFVQNATEIAMDAARQLLKENYKILTIKDATPLWKKLLEPKSRIAKQLERDMSLTAATVESLTVIWRQFEDLRDTLVAYQKNVELFKVRFSFV